MHPSRPLPGRRRQGKDQLLTTDDGRMRLRSPTALKPRRRDRPRRDGPTTPACPLRSKTTGCDQPRTALLRLAVIENCLCRKVTHHWVELRCPSGFRPVNGEEGPALGTASNCFHGSRYGLRSAGLRPTALPSPVIPWPATWSISISASGCAPRPCLALVRNDGQDLPFPDDTSMLRVCLNPLPITDVGSPVVELQRI